MQLAAGNPARTVEFNVSLLKRVFDIVMKNSDEAVTRREVDAALKKELAKIGKADDATLARVRASMDITRYRTPWMRFFLPYDPRPVLQKLTIPILAMNGEKDLQVLAAENLAAIDGAFKVAGNVNGQTLLLSGLNHLFQTSRTGVEASTPPSTRHSRRPRLWRWVTGLSLARATVRREGS
jgi:pimeloyl-ACP methyl ester carboxylesterase